MFAVLTADMRAALALLATTERIDVLHGELTALLNIEEEPDLEMPNFADLDTFEGEGDDWESGVSDLEGLDSRKLLQRFGITSGEVPFMNRTADKLDTHDRWLHSNAAYFKDPANTIPLAPRAHQIMAAVRLFERGFTGKAVLLADEVGVGKTMTVLTAI